MKRVILVIFTLCVALFGNAMTKDSIVFSPHEVRLGWGDMLYETAMYHADHYTGNYRYTGHIFATYQYRFLPWLSAGIDVDYEHVLWQKSPDSGINKTPFASCPAEWKTEADFFNICLIPQVRFTYYWSKFVNLYSGIGCGLLINGGSELNFRDQKTAFAPVIELTALGVQVGDNHWFGTVELGGLNAMSSLTDFYMLGSRLFSVSLGYRF